MARVLEFATTVRCSTDRRTASQMTYDEKLRILESLHPEMAKSIEDFINVTYEIERRRISG